MYQFLFLISVLSLASTTASAHLCPEDLVGKYQVGEDSTEFDLLDDTNKPLYKITFKTGDQSSQRLVEVGKNGAGCGEVEIDHFLYKALYYSDDLGIHSFSVGYLNGQKYLRQQFLIEKHFVAEGESPQLAPAWTSEEVQQVPAFLDLFESSEDCPKDLFGKFQLGADEIEVGQMGDSTKPIFKITKKMGHQIDQKTVEVGKDGVRCRKAIIGDSTYKVLYFNSSPSEIHSYSVYYSNGQKYLWNQLLNEKYLKLIEQEESTEEDQVHDLSESRKTEEAKRLRDQFHNRFKMLLAEKKRMGISGRDIARKCGLKLDDIGNLGRKNRFPTQNNLEAFKNFFTEQEIEFLWPKEKRFLLNKGNIRNTKKSRDYIDLMSFVSEFNS